MGANISRPSYTVDNMSRPARKPPIIFTLLLCALGALLGTFTGVITLVFIKLLDFVQHMIWTSLPEALNLNSSHAFYTIVICTLGGLFMGLGIKYFGNYPNNIKDELSNFKDTGEFNYRHIPGTIVNSVISLGFGAALGPEAALTSIIGGMSTWIGKKLHFLSLNKLSLKSLTISSTFGALFGSPLGSAALATPEEFGSATKLQLRLAGIAAAVAGLLTYKHSNSGGENYFNLNPLPYSFHSIDLLWAVLIGIAGFAAGIVFLELGTRTEKITKKVTNTFAKSVFGGFVLGILGALSPLILFSGHEGVRSLMSTYALTAGVTLILIALAKSLTTNILLATGWKGGQFFPVMFAGAAIGMGLANIFGLPPMVGLVAGMTAMLAVTVGKPLFAGILVIFFFPPNLYITVAVATLTASVLVRFCRKKKYFSALITN